MGNGLRGSFVVAGVLALVGVGCSAAPEGSSESSADPLARIGGGGIVATTPIVYPPEAFTAADVSCDLYDYFPEAPGSATAGWTTGSCPGAGSIVASTTAASFCSIDEGFANWQGPSVPNLGSHCRGARAMHHEWVSRAGGLPVYELVPTYPAARGGHVVPQSYCTETCFPNAQGGQTCITHTPVYDYVICPWAPGSNLDSWVTSEASKGGNPEKLHIKGYCKAGSSAYALTPTAGVTYAAIYEYDPQCTGCFPCD